VLAGEGGGLPVAAPQAPSTGVVNGVYSLDGAASTGSGALGSAWRQVAGPAAGLSGAHGAVPTFVPFAPGLHAFELTVTDASGAVSAPALVRVEVPAAGKGLPVAQISAPAEAAVGELVILNGKGSTGAARYRWTQAGGPWVAFDANSATPYFVASRPGSYAFELIVDDGTVRSAPAAVTVDVQ
jgi:chitinase